MRLFNAKLIAPILKITGYRFSKTHRHNETIIYKMIDTVSANLIANGSFNHV